MNDEENDDETLNPEQVLAKLCALYNQSDSADRGMFAEMRSNCLLYIGAHFNQKEMHGLRTMQKIEQAGPERKLRLVKNHIGIICDRLMNSTVTSHSPDVSIEARHKTDVQSKKAADIYTSVWHQIKNANRVYELVNDFAFNFIVVGEMVAFINFDQVKGKLIDSPLFDEMGMPMVDMSTGIPTHATEQKFNGEVVIQNLEPFNILTDPAAKSWEESEWVIYRKMVDVKALKQQYKGNTEILESICRTSEDVFTVFDAQKGSYGISTRDKCLVKYIFYRACDLYKEGYYIAYTNDVILEQGSLNGIWPLVYRAYQKVTTSRRGYGIIKRLRPCQAEINRIASTIAMSQLHFKDRLLIQNGSKISNGGTVAGAVGIKYSGAMPQIMQGQSGEKYLTVLQAQISELYQLANLSEEEEEKAQGVDSNGLLYRSLRDKKKYSLKSDIFESFIKEVCEVSLKTAKVFYDDSHIISSIDKKDLINIAEFKAVDDIFVSIEIKPQSGDLESTLGTQIAIQHAIQYGQNLPPEQLATLVANMPYIKDTAMALEITADYRAVEDVFASIERSQYISACKYDNHKYFIKKISNRIKESSFSFLQPNIQQYYMQRLQEHETIEAANLAQVQRAEMGMIPASGALIPVSIYLNEANASKRVRVPHDALIWLVKKLDEQGSLQQDAQGLGSGASGDIAQTAATQFQNPQLYQGSGLPQTNTNMTQQMPQSGIGGHP